MDTSETYIKMCDCEEIQKHKPDMGIVPPTNEDTFIGKYGCYWVGDYDWVEQHSRYIWLPRQDQLQEMLLPDVLSIMHLAHNFSEFVLPYELAETLSKRRDHWTALAEMTKNRQYICQSTSMEQLWLAFVMKEKYNKIWDGEGWTCLKRLTNVKPKVVE